jgi:hypothetical protein
MHVHRGSSREKKRTDTADSGIPSDSPSECIKDVEAEQWPKEQTRAGCSRQSTGTVLEPAAGTAALPYCKRPTASPAGPDQEEDSASGKGDTRVGERVLVGRHQEKNPTHQRNQGRYGIQPDAERALHFGRFTA